MKYSKPRTGKSRDRLRGEADRGFLVFQETKAKKLAVPIQVTKSYRASPTKTFLAGLMDWKGDSPPTPENIAGKQTIVQGVAHIRTIYETGLGEMITGFRPLESDSIEPDSFRSQTGYQPGICMLN